MRFARRKADSNHQDIIQGLEQWGASVLDLSAVGGGCPDLLVGWRNINLLVEVKRPGLEQVRKRGRRQAGTDQRQQTFAESWRGIPVLRATTTEAVIQRLQSLAGAYS